MKFGHVFKETLRQEGFPPAWVDASISYSQLKKCINRLTNELADVGLDRHTLAKLLRHVEHQNAAAAEDHERLLEYHLAQGKDDDHAGLPPKPDLFRPKLLIYVNETTGELDSARLDDETRSKLQTLAVETGISHVRVFEEPDAASTTIRPGYRTVEVPLTSDSEFFHKLSSELMGLEAWQEKEERRMHGEIEELGKQVARLTDPDRKANRKVLAVWRQIFQMYVESDIFFGSTEVDHTRHSADKAAQKFQKFAVAIADQGLVDKLKREDSIRALNAFMHVNHEMLQGLRFSEINRTAMMKILKKFDKQTALGIKSSFPQHLAYPDFAGDLAKAVCAEVNTQILSNIPQLDDYSCPMCMEIKWRPVRLRCQHVFCIRCLIVMQTNKQHNCPLCREKTVIDANSDNLDLELADFLKKWFPDEVKAKQKYNQLMAGVDQYGEVYKDRCCVM